MKLSVRALAISSGLIWSGGMLVCGLVSVAKPRYGQSFLNAMSEVYPGFHNSRTVPDAFVGAGYGLLDGAAAGALIAVLYNQFAEQ